MDKHKVLEQLLMELHHFLLILDKETLSGNATVHKGLLTDLLQSYGTSNGADEEYIYMNKVIVSSKEKQEKDETADVPVNGKASKHAPVPQKSLPDLPPPRTDPMTREPFPLPAVQAPCSSEASESYYEEAQPYEETVNDDGEAVSSSYESYDEEEAASGVKSAWAQHRWPSAEASIELMKDARICGFLWRKKWLGQWAKQLCVIREHRLMCYKSSKEQTPLLDVSLLGCSVTYKEKQPKRKEHKLKIVPMGGEAVVLGLQSKEQTEQWLKVIQEISPKPGENGDSQHFNSDSPRLICTKGDITERHSATSESGSSTDSPVDVPEKDVKKKYSGGLKLSNLMNIGKKKATSLESAEKCIETSGYLNVLVNSQWRMCWCLIKNGHLCFYQDKNKGKISQPAVKLEGCQVWPDPSPDHLYSFQIHMSGTQLATLEAKTSAVMGHWLGLLLSQTGSKTDPEELTHDYTNVERIASIVNAAKTSLYLMQRRYSEPNTYIDPLPCNPHNADELYDDVASITDPEDIVSGSFPQSKEQDLEGQNETSAETPNEPVATDEEPEDRVYLDLVPVRSFLHTVSGGGRESPRQGTSGNPSEELKEPSSPDKEVRPNDLAEPIPASTLNDSSSAKEEQANSKTPLPIQEPTKRTSMSSGVSKILTLPTNTVSPLSPQLLRPKAFSTGCPSAVEGKLGKKRTEADLLRYSDERERLEREREEVRGRLACLKKERKETKEELSACQDARQQASLETRLKQMEEAGREAEQRRVEVELLLMEVKESLKKVEAGPFTLGTALDGNHQDTSTTKSAALPSTLTVSPPPSGPVSDGPTAAGGPASPVNSASALKNRPASIMATKGKVLQKAKEWEKKSTT